MTNRLTNGFYFTLGIFFLILSKIRFLTSGYSPKNFSINEFQRCADYDTNTVDWWLEKLQEYAGGKREELLKNKRVLELGPGSDLGVGLYILGHSAAEYHAVDIYNLVESVPAGFYDVFFDNLARKGDFDIPALKQELHQTTIGQARKLHYHCREDFDIEKALGSRKMDLVFSNASFEHFNNISETIRAVSRVSKPGTQLVALVDLKTHSRWIRQKDPNNIYRYPQWLYNLLRFRSTPNRVRPYQYKAAFERYGWKDIRIEAECTLEGEKYRATRNHLAKPYRGDKNQMDYLDIWIYATKS